MSRGPAEPDAAPNASNVLLRRGNVLQLVDSALGMASNALLLAGGGHGTGVRGAPSGVRRALHVVQGAPTGAGRAFLLIRRAPTAVARAFLGVRCAPTEGKSALHPHPSCSYVGAKPIAAR